MLTLYFHPFSQHARRVVALLNETGIDCELREVDMAGGEYKSDAYAAINPNRQVPTLVDGETRVHESNAILRYLCLRYGLDDWYPPAPAERAIVEQWLDWNQCRLSPPVMDIVLNSLFLGEAGDPAAIERGRQQLPGVLDVLETFIAGRRYLAGDKPTIADLSVGSNLSHLDLVNARPSMPGIDAWYQRLCRLDGFAAALPPPLAA